LHVYDVLERCSKEQNIAFEDVCREAIPRIHRPTVSLNVPLNFSGFYALNLTTFVLLLQYQHRSSTLKINIKSACAFMKKK